MQLSAAATRANTLSSKLLRVDHVYCIYAIISTGTANKTHQGPQEQETVALIREGRYYRPMEALKFLSENIGIGKDIKI